MFALSGVLLRDPPLATPDLLQVVLISVAFDALLAIAVLPAVHAGLSRLEPEQAPA